jgi:hypothetical protein
VAGSCENSNEFSGYINAVNSRVAKQLLVYEDLSSVDLVM